jgi:hypothetical protein
MTEFLELKSAVYARVQNTFTIYYKGGGSYGVS